MKEERKPISTPHSILSEKQLQKTDGGILWPFGSIVDKFRHILNGEDIFMEDLYFKN